MISTINYSQTSILKDILNLYIKNTKFDLDPTFSKGNFYKEIEKPTISSDINPQDKKIWSADCRYLFLKNNIINSIIFDPPFLIGVPNKSKNTTGSNLISNRFGSFKTKKKLFEFYEDSLKEFHRVLNPGGYLVFKCQDTVSGGKQEISHCYIWKMATDIGFEVIDLFVLLAKNRMMSGKWKQQVHARKFHSYFWIFQK